MDWLRHPPDGRNIYAIISNSDFCAATRQLTMYGQDAMVVKVEGARTVYEDDILRWN